jgi:hypothetical protein
MDPAERSPMNRTGVIQKIIDTKNAVSYLEIGVQYGANFFRIKARQKIAVDPKFTFFNFRTLVLWLKYNRSKSCAYNKCTSDEYFQQLNQAVTFDVIFIDGLHTYKQSLEDVNNALARLNDGGVIILHDCNPPSEAAAYPVDSLEDVVKQKLPGWTGDWCGDVWKTVCDLRSNRMDLKIFVLNCDLGLGIIMKGESRRCLRLTLEELNAMTFADFAARRENLLDLKSESYLADFLKTLEPA